MENNKMKKTYIIEAIIVILILFVVTWTYLRLKAMAEISATNRIVPQYEPYEPFAIVVQETTWDGYREGTKIFTKNNK